MELRVISTGSAANCYALEADGETLILDAGVSVKKVLPQTSGRIVGVLVTHEHGDHARAAKEWYKRGVKVFMSAGTAGVLDDGCLYSTVTPLKAFKAGKYTVLAFETQHDAVEPCGYIIRYEPTGETVLYATDTYYVKYRFPNVDYWIVECNYCFDLLSDEDEVIRKRLLKSHMSLEHLKEMLAANDMAKARKVVLVHLSDSRSDEERMVREIGIATMVDTVAARNGMEIGLTEVF